MCAAASHGGPLPASLLPVPPPHRHQPMALTAHHVPLHPARWHALNSHVRYLHHDKREIQEAWIYNVSVLQLTIHRCKFLAKHHGLYNFFIVHGSIFGHLKRVWRKVCHSKENKKRSFNGASFSSIPPSSEEL